MRSLRRSAKVGGVKYLQLDWIERDMTDEEAAVLAAELPKLGAELGTRGIRIAGHSLHHPGTARLVRVREGQPQIARGPFVESKSGIAGFNLLNCESLEQAIELVARNPVSWFEAIELRQLRDGSDLPEYQSHDVIRQMLMMCGDGRPDPPEVAAEIERDSGAWREAVERRGVYVLGGELVGAREARTVRVRDERTLVSDGPVVEGDLQLTGFAVLSCENLPDALGWAAMHPIARFHAIEVRQVSGTGGGT